ncbi:MAG: recombinase family protein [Patescibacteria group bacterium]
MNCLIIARVSTEEQREAGNSLPAQIARLQAYCQRGGFEVIGQHSFDESAYKTKRDEFDRILARLNQCKDKVAVCFDKVDRFSRNVFDKRVAVLYEMAVSGKIELHFASDGLVINNEMSAPDKFHFSMSLGLAKYYSDAISDNVKRSFEQKRRRGEWTGRAPIGYLNATNDLGEHDIIPDQATAHIVRRMFELHATGSHSIRTLRGEAEQMGLRGRSGKPIPTSMVEHILKNPFYYGTARAKGELYPHKYQPLIDKELFDACQRIRQGWHKKPFAYAAKPFVLRGLIRCGRCGCAMTPEIKKGKYVYYRCTNARPEICSTKEYIPEKDLLKPVRAVLGALGAIRQETVDELITELKKSHEAESAFNRRAFEGLTSEYEEIQTRLDKLMDFLIDGSITKPDYDKKLKQLKERQSEITVRLEEHTRADENYLISATTVLNLARNASEIFESSEVAEKRQILNFLLQNCRVEGREMLFDLKKPFDVIAKSALASASAQTENSAFGAVRPMWLPVLDALRTASWKALGQELAHLDGIHKIRACSPI